MGRNMDANSKKSLSFLVLNHYVKEYENIKPQGALDLSSGTKQVSKMQCDASILFNLISKNLGLTAPDILPVYSSSRNKTIVSGVLEVPNLEENQEIQLARHFHDMLNNSFYEIDVLNKLSVENLKKSERENLIKELILSRLSVEGKRPVDFLFLKNNSYSLRFFSDEALKDLIKIRVAKMATFDTTNSPSAIYKYNKKLGLVENVFALKNISSKMTLDQVSQGRKDGLKYDNEFCLKPQTFKEALCSIKDNPQIKEFLGKEDLGEIVNNLQRESVNKIASKLYIKTGLKLDSLLVDAVSHQVDDICDTLTK